MSRSTPEAAQAATSSSVAHSPPTVTSNGWSSRPASARWPRMMATAAAAESGVLAMPIQPSPRRPALRSACADSPPMRMGMGCCTGLGSKATSAKGKYGPSWAIVSSVHSRRQTPMASSSRAPRVAGSMPSASHSERSQPAPAPMTARPPETQSSVAKARAVMKGWRRPSR